MKAIDFSQYKSIVILTGAGVSVASGIRPFRGEGGLWNEVNAAGVADRSVLEKNPLALWRLFGPLRTQLKTTRPNPAHHALAELEQSLPSRQKFLLVTQNVDGLHQKAGSQRVVELHGSVHKTRCSNPACDLEPFEDGQPHTEVLPMCPKCKSPLRLNMVLFGEQIPTRAEWESKRALRDCDLFIAVGTSGTVAPASNFVRSAEYVGARTILVNLEPTQPKNRYFQEEYIGRAEEILPKLSGLP